MNILVISDIHNDVENIFSYTDKIALIDFDAIVALGDFTDYNLPKGFTPVDIGELIIQELNIFKKPILAVPGNFDKDLLPVFEEHGINLHGKGRIIGGVGFYGFGGARTPFNTPFEPSENEIEKGLERGYETVKSCKSIIQVTHMPPIDTKVDVAYTGSHIGSGSVRKMIEKHKPSAAICAHVHEAKGVDELGRTKIINSGRFPEGYCGLVTIRKDVTTAKIINLI